MCGSLNRLGKRPRCAEWLLLLGVTRLGDETGPRRRHAVRMERSVQILLATYGTPRVDAIVLGHFVAKRNRQVIGNTQHVCVV